MEISVRIIQLLEPQSFVSKRDGSTIFKYTFVGETAGQYPKKVAFTVMGEDKFKGMGIAVGNSYSVSFDVESREWNGKWFTEVSAWKAIKTDGVAVATSSDGGAQQAQKPQQDASPFPNTAPANDDGGEKGDDLPF